MIELILTTLAEFGLISQDYKHQKKIKKLEKADGKKRPFEKYLLQPSAIVIYACIVIVSVSSIIFFNYQSSVIYPKTTGKEIAEISERIRAWNDKYGTYPSDILELIGNDPTRQDWIKDSWNRPYQYSVFDSGNGFLIVSAGSDGKFNTEDDIRSK